MSTAAASHHEAERKGREEKRNRSKAEKKGVSNLQRRSDAVARQNGLRSSSICGRPVFSRADLSLAELLLGELAQWEILEKA